MRNKELIAEMEKLKKAVAWLGNHDRNDVEFCIIDGGKYIYIEYSAARYFYNGEVKVARFPYRNWSCNFEVLKNDDKTIIARDDVFDKYFQIDKATATVTEIPKPEIVDDNTNKQAENLLYEKIDKRVDFLGKQFVKLQETVSSYKIDELREELVKLNKSWKDSLDLTDRLWWRIGGIQEVVEFTNTFGKDSIHFEPLSKDVIKVSYLYNNKRLGQLYGFKGMPVCVKNDSIIAILECNGKYYQLDKEHNSIVEIPKPAFVVEKKKSSKKAKK